MNGTTGADLLVDALAAYGVEHVFGNPGTTELPVVHAVEQSDLSYRLALHEDVAVGMAAGYASTRRYHADRAEQDSAAEPPRPLPLGVANLHLTAGLAHGLGNLYGASMAGAPVLVTAGAHASGHRHADPIMSEDLVGMADPFTKWAAEVPGVDALPSMLRRAVRTALAPPSGPVFLALPVDVTLAETDAEPEPLGPIPTAGRGDPAQLARAAELLADRSVEDVAVIVGDGVARAGRDAVAAAVDLAEAAGARIHGEVLAAEVNVPTAHEQFAGVLAPDADRVREAMAADVVCLLGCTTHTTPEDPGEALVASGTTVIGIGPDPVAVGRRYPLDAAVVGDPGSIAAELAEVLADELPEDVRTDRRERARSWIDARAVEAPVDPDATEDAGRPTPLDLAEAMAEATDGALVVDEGVTAKYALFERAEFEPTTFLSNGGGGLGYGLPAAVGAALAERERSSPRDVIAFVGDGSVSYYPQAVYSAVRAGLDLTIVIANNGGYRVVEDNAASLLEDGVRADLDATTLAPPIDAAAAARGYGADGDVLLDRRTLAEDLAAAVDRAGVDVLDVRLAESDRSLR